MVQVVRTVLILQVPQVYTQQQNTESLIEFVELEEEELVHDNSQGVR